MKKITGYKIVYTVHDEETGVLTEHLVDSAIDPKNLEYYINFLEEGNEIRRRIIQGEIMNIK
tara:strand:- start:1040 stop:1225 length:186 start_codon:yes stop_codon:yes gene_type:complete